MKAYTVVGPTKVQPRFFRSFDSAIDSGELVIAFSAVHVNRRGRDDGPGSKRQT